MSGSAPAPNEEHDVCRDRHLLRFANSSFHAASTSASRFIESPLILPSSVAACSSGGRVLCQSSVSFAVTASGRNVRPFVSAFAALRRWYPAVRPYGGCHTVICDHGRMPCVCRNSHGTHVN